LRRKVFCTDFLPTFCQDTQVRPLFASVLKSIELSQCTPQSYYSCNVFSFFHVDSSRRAAKMDQGIENLLLVSLGLVFVGAVGLWGLARALALLTSVSISSFAKQGAWQATVQQYAVFVKRLADEFFGSGAALWALSLAGTL